MILNLAKAQERVFPEKYGQTLNLGAGIGYMGFIGRTVGVLNMDVEFDAARNFTLAPFAKFYTYSRGYFWGSKGSPYRYYMYRATVIPLGVKGSYYFDELLRAPAAWDFYGAGSLGFTVASAAWEKDYSGDLKAFPGPRPLFIDIHAGAEYKFGRAGVFFDLSTGVSTIGLGLHF